MLNDDINDFVRRRSYLERQEWIEVIDAACGSAEARAKMYRRSRPDLADVARAFVEQGGAVLFWLRTGGFPDTRHACVQSAIDHIRKQSGE